MGIPDWILKSKKFQKKFKLFWEENYVSKQPFSDIEFFQKSIKKLAKKFNKENTNNKFTPLDRLNSALELLRETSKINYDPIKIRQILSRQPALRYFITLNISTGTYN